MKMKKTLLVAALTLMATFMAQAAQVSWTMFDIMRDGEKIKKGTYVAYLFDVRDLIREDALTAAKVGTLDVTKAIETTNGLGPGVCGVTGAMCPVLDSEKYPGGEDQTFYAVVYDTVNPNKGKFFITNEKTAMVPGVGAATVAFGSMENATWIDVVPVPEPTTFALLALGLAAFGLKRKIA